MSIGQRLKEARKLRDLSQANLANVIGVSRGVISNIEYEKVTDSPAILIKGICDALNINQEWLLFGKGAMEKENNNNQILDEIRTYLEKLSEDELLFILDVTKSYSKFLSKKE